MQRREFLHKIAGVTAGYMAGVTAGAVPTESRASESKAINNLLRSMFEGFFNNCPQHRIIGICFSGFPPFPSGVKVRMYIPTALIEVFKQPFESLYAQKGFDLDSSRVLNQSFYRDESVFQARVWQLMDDFRSTLTFGLADCFWCWDRDLGVGGGGVPMRGGGGGGVTNAGSQMLDSASQLGCYIDGDAEQLISDMTQQAFSGAEIGGLKLVYSSDVDQPSWTNGCRDRLTGKILAPITFAACGLAGVTEELAGKARALASELGVSGGGSRGGRGGGGGSSVDGALNADAQGVLGALDQMCVGAWGPLYPRQMRTFGGNDPARAALTGFRALHIANQIGSFDPALTQNAKYQTVYPVLEECYGVGNSIEQLGRMTTQSPDGRYGFIYWQPVECCISFERFSSGCSSDNSYG